MITFSIVSHNQGALVNDLLVNFSNLNDFPFDLIVTSNTVEDVPIIKVQDFQIKIIKNSHPKGFGAIVLDNVLEHIIDPTLLLIEISRVLKPKGKLLVGVPGIKGYKRDPDHKIFYDLELLIKLMNHNNFSYIDHFYQPITFINLSKLISQHSLYSIYDFGN